MCTQSIFIYIYIYTHNVSYMYVYIYIHIYVLCDGLLRDALEPAAETPTSDPSPPRAASAGRSKHNSEGRQVQAGRSTIT